MSREEFDKYLESIGGLVSGYRTDAEPIKSSYFFECGPGWNDILHRLIVDLIALGWDKKICQVKEKFGGLRFYINGGTKEIFDRISEAEVEASGTCENCGEPGKIGNDNGWYSCRCDKCK